MLRGVRSDGGLMEGCIDELMMKKHLCGVLAIRRIRAHESDLIEKQRLAIIIYIYFAGPQQSSYAPLIVRAIIQALLPSFLRPNDCQSL